MLPRTALGRLGPSRPVWSHGSALNQPTIASSDVPTGACRRPSEPGSTLGLAPSPDGLCRGLCSGHERTFFAGHCPASRGTLGKIWGSSRPTCRPPDDPLAGAVPGEAQQPMHLVAVESLDGIVEPS